MEYIQLLAGFALLLTSGHYLVRGGICLARGLNISTLVVGMVVVSLGTSAPEFFVSLTAAIADQPDISVGNVVGSNISNIGLVLGLAAVILPITVRSVSVKYDGPVMIISGILLYVFGMKNSTLDRWEGILFCVLLLVFIVVSLIRSRKANQMLGVKKLEAKYSLKVSLLIVVISSVGLMFGANLLVDGAIVMARDFGVSERAIGISIIAVGTSIPELATSVIAAIKKEMDISIGNIIGSNIYNTFGILGTTAIIRPLQFNEKILNFDIFWMLGFFLVLFIFILPFKGGKLRRYQGMIFLIGYAFYIYLVFYL